MEKSLNVIIAASGTGGHIFPAKQIAYALKKQIPNINLLFIGAGRPLEEKLIDQEGFKRKAIKMAGVRNLGIKGVINLTKLLPRAFYEMVKTFKEFKPDVVVGVGGYVSFLPVLVARLKGIPSVICEQDLSAGISNRVLSFFATKICVAFPNSNLLKKKKTIYSGHTLRNGLIEVRNQELKGEPKNILIMGGSQGARNLDKLVKNLASFFKENNLNVWHQCRKEDEDEVKEEFEKQNLEARVMPFIEDMKKAYEFADIIISRAGASSVMEILAINKPAIFIPLPGAGAHQRPNADFLANFGKAFVVEENEENFEGKVKEVITKLLDKDYYLSMKNKEIKGIELDGASKIKDEVLKLVKEKI